MVKLPLTSWLDVLAPKRLTSCLSLLTYYIAHDFETRPKDPDDFDWVRDRPGHDRRYAIDSTKLQTELG